jgi:hypothetical protein
MRSTPPPAVVCLFTSAETSSGPASSSLPKTTAQPLAWGARPTCHAPGVPVPVCEEGKTAAQGAWYRPAVTHLFISAESSKPVSDTGARAHESSSLGAGSWMQRSRTAARTSTAPPRGRRRRQKFFENQSSGIEAPRAWPSKTIKYEGDGSVSRGDRRDSWRDRGQTGSNYASGRTEASTPIDNPALAPPAGSYPPLRRARGPLSVPWKWGTRYYSMKVLCPCGYP